MLYSEFIEGTQCRDNDFNHKVYKNLEILYMSSDLTKEEIYEYGKKLVDNSKTAEEIAFEEEIKAEMRKYKQYIKDAKQTLEYYRSIDRKDMIKIVREEIREYKRKIYELNWVLN